MPPLLRLRLGLPRLRLRRLHRLVVRPQLALQLADAQAQELVLLGLFARVSRHRQNLTRARGAPRIPGAPRGDGAAVVRRRARGEVPARSSSDDSLLQRRRSGPRSGARSHRGTGDPREPHSRGVFLVGVGRVAEVILPARGGGRRWGHGSGSGGVRRDARKRFFPVCRDPPLDENGTQNTRARPRAGRTPRAGERAGNETARGRTSGLACPTPAVARRRVAS